MWALLKNYFRLRQNPDSNHKREFADDTYLFLPKLRVSNNKLEVSAV